MGSSRYPGDFDTDAQIPRVDDAITEIGGEAIDALRDAMFAVQRALGLDPQGSLADLATRLAVSIDDSGSIKASALAAAGLVSLPIDNSQIASNAGIEESKLDLDHSTTSLKTALDSLTVLVQAIEDALNLDIARLAQHIAHPSAYGRHEAADVDVVLASSNLDGYTVQEGLDDLDTRLLAHLADTVAAHAASAISVDPSSFQTIESTDVQSALDTLEKLELTELTRHRDDQHGNGVLGAQDTVLPGQKRSVEIIASASISSVSAGDSSVKFSIAPDADAFQSIVRNDRLEVTISGKTYVRVVRGTESINQVNFFGTLPVSGIGTAAVYRSSEETSAPSSLKVAVRKSDVVSRPAVVQLVHPAAPFLLSSGFQGSKLSSARANIRFLYPAGDTGEVDLYSLMTAFSSSPSTWTAENVAKVLNEDVFAPGGNVTHDPLIAFVHEGEIGVALDEPLEDGYLEAGTISSLSGMEALGFTQGDRDVTRASRLFYIDGYRMSGGIRKVLDAYATILTTDTLEVSGFSDLTALGLGPGSLVRVDGPGIRTGTYVADDVVGNQIEFDSTQELDFGAGNLGKGLDIRVYSDHFSVTSTPLLRTLYETFVDGYEETLSADFLTAERATYSDTSGGGASLEGIFDLVAVSRGFRIASKRLFYDFSAGTVELGDQASGPSVNNTGPRASVPAPAASNPGHRVRVYDDYGVEYLDLEVAGTLPGADGYMDIEVQDRISEERFTQVATVLNDRTDFKRLDDRRLFGTTGRRNVRDDFTRDLVSYPRSVLRGNGVVYGLEATGTGSGSLEVSGGQALVDGSLKGALRASLEIPADGAATYNLFMARDGSLRLLRDDFHSTGILTTPSLSELLSGGTETVLAQVDTNGSNVITEIRDLRRFVGDIDSKLELLAEENDITHGSFASLRAAADWISAQDAAGLPTPRRIKVRGEIFIDAAGGSLSLPSGTIVEGDSARGWGGSSDASTITVQGSGSNLFIPGDGVIFRNLRIRMTNGASLSRMFGDGSSAISNLSLVNCDFSALYDNSAGLAVVGSEGGLTDCVVHRCRFNFAGGTAGTGFTAVGRLSGSGGAVDNLVVSECEISAAAVSSPLTALALPAAVSRLTVRDTKIEGLSTSANSILDTGSSVVSESLVENCVFDLDGTGSVFFDSVLDSTAFRDCRLTGTNASPAAGGIAGPRNSCVISGCSLDNIDLQVSSDDVDGLAVSDSLFANLDSYGISLGATGVSACDNVTIRDCVFDKSSAPAAGDAMIKLFRPGRCSLVGNNMECTSTAAHAGSMIRIAETSEDLVIANNILIDTAAVTQGMRRGIVLDGGAGTPFGDHVQTLVSGNRVLNFLGPSGASPTGRGLDVSNATDLRIIGNSISNCSFPVDLFDCGSVLMTGNLLASEVGIGDSPALNIGGSSAAPNELNYIITGNLFQYFTLVASTAQLVRVSTSWTGNAGFGTVQGNIFQYFALSSAFSIVDFDSSVHNVDFVGNHFWTSFLTFPVAFSVEPLTIDGDNCLVALNNLEQLTPPSSGAIALGGTASTDILNKGQTYIVPISAADATFLTASTTEFLAFGVPDLPHQLRFTAAGDGFIPFSQYIPVGATITQIVVGYNSGAAGAATDLEYRWLKTSEPTGPTGSGVVVSSLFATVADGTDRTVTVTADLVPSAAVMVSGDFHYLHIDVDAASGGNIKDTYGIEVHYRL